MTTARDETSSKSLRRFEEASERTYESFQRFERVPRHYVQELTELFRFMQGQITASRSLRPWDREDAGSRTVPFQEHQLLS